MSGMSGMSGSGPGLSSLSTTLDSVTLIATTTFMRDDGSTLYTDINTTASYGIHGITGIGSTTCSTK